MKLLLDQGLPRSAALHLRERGVDAVHTGEVGLATAEDSEILRSAAQHGRIVVTLDADFHRLLAMSGAVNPSVIRVRIEGLRGEGLARLLGILIADYREELTRGVALTVQSAGIRLRQLPLRR